MSTTMFGLIFESVTFASAVTQILDAAKQKKKGLIVTPNVDHIVMLQDDAEMKRIYENAMFRYADGMPIVWLSKILNGEHLPERVTGADLLIAVCEKSAHTALNIFFLGGNPGIAEQAAKKLQSQFHNLKIAGFYCPPFGFEHNQAETDRIIDDINSRNVDILFIGVGAPKQEKWAAKHLDRLHVGPILCVGAAFDFAAGIIKRAPLWIQKSGMEWFWRLASEPGRMWKRYLVRDSRFIPLAIKEISKSIFNSNSQKKHA
jgi:N-acetylglucosaminyldiphosphoundecaprenol N-acetyl-beta-D-mannosaminyltransferase